MDKLQDFSLLSGDFVPRKVKINEIPKSKIPISCAGNLPACGGIIYSNTYWLPEDVEDLLDDLVDGMTGG